MRNVKYRGLWNSRFHHRGIEGKSQGIYPYGRLRFQKKLPKQAVTYGHGAAWPYSIKKDIIPLMVSRLPDVGTFGDAIEIDFVGVVE
jgi:hypothetical protein